jgi:hypothetical protein
MINSAIGTFILSAVVPTTSPTAKCPWRASEHPDDIQARDANAAHRRHLRNMNGSRR